MRFNHHDKEQCDEWEALHFPDAELVEEGSEAYLIEGIVDLGMNIEALRPRLFPVGRR